MDTRLTEALNGFRTRYPGQESAWKRLEGWLLDHAPTEKRAAKALASVPKLDLHLEIEKLKGTRVDAFAFRRMTDAITSQEGLAGDLVEQAVLVWLSALGVEAPDQTALRGPLDAGAIAASIEVCRVLHVSMKDLPIISQVRLEGLTNRAHNEVLVSVWLSGADSSSPLKSTTWSQPIERIRGKQVVILEDVNVNVTQKALHELRAPLLGRFWIEVKTKDDVLLRSFQEVEALPPATWPMGRVPLPALAAFVLREDAIARELVSEAATRVSDSDPRPSGVKAVAALLAVLGELDIAITNTPVATTNEVRSPRAVLQEGAATSLDVQLMLAACLEHGGMSPLLVWASSGPAIGIWTTEQRPALTETDDAELIARIADSGALVLVPIGDHVLRLREPEEKTSFFALDLLSARKRGVLPLDSIILRDSDKPKPHDARQRLLDRAALHANRTGMLLPGAWGARLGRRPDGGDTTPPRLQQWKRRLLDLTLNNPLLNAKLRVTSLPLMVHDCGALEDALATGQTFRLEARPPAPSPGVPKPDVTREMTANAMTGGALLVDLTDKRVITQAKNAQRAFKGALEEGGVHTLFLTLGSLEWLDASKGSQRAEPRRAPLLLVPVLIRRTKAGYYEIKKADGETELNAALIEFLRREHGVEVNGVDPLPQDHAGVDVPAVFAAFKRALQSTPATSAWTVHDEAQMGILAFSGFRMWRDLDHQAADLLRHALVRRLAVGVVEEGGDAATDDVDFAKASSLDDRFAARDVLCPLEADGSQLTAVLAAAEGKSFVLEGPPGTGKSQTIANLIAQCLASGKTVLFVSQKRAALEVVESRLSAIGLAPFLLELHSKKASKPEFIQQLRLAAELRAQKPPRDWNAEADQLAAARNELNAAVRALHAVRDPGMSVYQAIADAEARRDGPRLELGVHVDFDSARAFDKAWVADAKANVADLVGSFGRLGQGWEDLDAVRATDWPRAKRDALEVELRSLEDAAPALEEACRGLERWMPNLASASADDLELADVVLGQIESSPRPRLQLLWDDGGNKEVEPWIARVEATRKKAIELGATWRPELLKETLEPRIRTIRQWMGVFLLGWLMVFFQRWFFRAFAKSEVPPNARLVADAEAVVKLQAERDAILSEQIDIAKRIGDLELDEWGLPVVDAEAVKKLLAFAATFRKRTVKFPNVLELAAEGAPTESAAPMKAFRAALATWNEKKRVATASLDLSGGFTKPTEAAHITNTALRAKLIRERSGLLRDWGAHRRNRDACVALGLGKLVRAIEKREVPADTVSEAVSNTWLSWWIDQRVASDKALASFDGLKQRAREERFAQLDRTTRELARHEIISRIAARQPRLDSGAPPTSQAGILLRQFGRRAGFASPRQLFSECAGLIRQLKPCVLMSPQSVAQYLDPSQPPFDVVVFDEASQVPTHEAIGAIARGRHVVVVGDSKQLPPTSFFLGGAQNKADGDEGDGASAGDEVLAELDSILEECSASGLASLRLGWHYRSRHPSLIAFSNTRYYGSRLQVLPSAEARPANLGVSVTHVKGAVYDRGNTATNAGEARALVAELVRRLRDPNESQRSLGVVTFSRSQQALVEDLLEEARAQYPEIEPFFDPERAEPLIVKNLENIQGDERDVVLFSIGYGPDAKGKMTANMGPLGQLGGERRLNVAITRAREQLVVFVSFEPKQLDLSSSSAQGLHDLKAFLETSASWEDVVMGNAGAQADVDPAEVALKRALASRLEDAGYTVDLDVGVGTSRVDIAVRDRKDPNRYVCGIEIDGPRYAAMSTARDRDRLRWDVLAGLGWRMHRMRALDWYEDRDAVALSALRAIEEAETALPGVRLEGSNGDSNGGEGAHLSPLPPELTQTPAPVASVSTSAPPSERTPKCFYRIAKPAPRTGALRWENVQTAEVVAEIVEEEGPIAERLLARRIAEAWGLKRAPAMTGQISALLGRITEDKRPVHRDGFFWPAAHKDPDSWRMYRVPEPADPDTRRDAEDIPIEELANCADDLLARYGTMPHEDLARAIAKRFGFRGLTKVVAQRVDLGIVHASRRSASTSP